MSMSMISIPLEEYKALVAARHTVHVLDAITKLEYIPEEVIRTILEEIIEDDPHKCLGCTVSDDEPYCDECGAMEE